MARLREEIRPPPGEGGVLGFVGLALGWMGILALEVLWVVNTGHLVPLGLFFFTSFGPSLWINEIWGNPEWKKNFGDSTGAELAGPPIAVAGLVMVGVGSIQWLVSLF